VVKPPTPGELEQAYAVLAAHFGVSHSDMKELIAAHFQGSATSLPEPEQDTTSGTWTLDELRQTLARLDDLRAQGLMPPGRRYIIMNSMRKNKRGKYYAASQEQLQEDLAMQERSSIDSYGNLVVNGEVVTRGWLASFDKKDL